jgi:hypothetical protein
MVFPSVGDRSNSALACGEGSSTDPHHAHVYHLFPVAQSVSFWLKGHPRSDIFPSQNQGSNSWHAGLATDERAYRTNCAG